LLCFSGFRTLKPSRSMRLFFLRLCARTHRLNDGLTTFLNQKAEVTGKLTRWQKQVWDGSLMSFLRSRWPCVDRSHAIGS